MLVAIIVVVTVVVCVSVLGAIGKAIQKPVIRPTPSSTTSSSVPKTPSTSGYNPSKLPIPSTYTEAETWLKNNALYQQAVPGATKCSVAPVDPKASNAELQAKLNQTVQCMTDVWQTPLSKAGFELPKPPVTVYSGTVTTACGDQKDRNAAYCGGDQQIYFAKNVLSTLPGKVGTSKYAAEAVLAHEFGHAVQARTGMLASEIAWEKKVSEADARALSRRFEMQADCFEGLYFSSVAQSLGLTSTDRANLANVSYAVGDDILTGDPNIDAGHGLGKNRQAWFSIGLETTKIGSCNTWTVPAPKVR